MNVKFDHITSTTKLLESIDTMSAADVLEYFEEKGEDIEELIASDDTKAIITDVITKVADKLTAEGSGVDQDEVAGLLEVFKAIVDSEFEADTTNMDIKGLQTLLAQKLDALDSGVDA